MDGMRSRPTAIVPRSRAARVDRGCRVVVFRGRLLDGRDAIPSYGYRSPLSRRVAIFRGRLLDGRDAIPSYGYRGRFRASLQSTSMPLWSVLSDAAYEMRK